jgi:hypothetical protein
MSPTMGLQSRSGNLPRADALGYYMPPLRGSFYFFNRLSAKETLLSQSDRRLSREPISKVSAIGMTPADAHGHMLAPPRG